MVWENQRTEKTIWDKNTHCVLLDKDGIEVHVDLRGVIFGGGWVGKSHKNDIGLYGQIVGVTKNFSGRSGWVWTFSSIILDNQKMGMGLGQQRIWNDDFVGK